MDKVPVVGSFMLAPVPVVLVGCAHPELDRNLLTIAWCGVGCSDPQTIHISVRPERHSYRMIVESGCFTVNIPTVEMIETVDLCGIISGRDGDKFERAGLTALAGTKVDAPLVAECPVNIECTVREIIEIGVHNMFLGEIVARHADGTAAPGGKPDFREIPLITYINGEYWSVGEPLGRYGCSRKKI